MSRRYFTSRGVAINLIDEVGRGGEGSVFGLPDERLVAKIYHSPIGESKAEKLRWMADNCTDQLLKTSAWILETVHKKPGGEMVGLVMPRISAKEVHELYSPKSRRLYFPKADWRFLIQTAKNLAVAFNNLHAAGHVIGDVNQGNVVVQPDTTVKLIDCDSYQLTVNGRVFPCEVGVSTHIPPELQGTTLGKIVRTQNHDNFGLAVIIFQLLFLGRHPFAGNYIGAEDKTLDESIKEHLFAYGPGASQRRVRQPPGTLRLEALNPELARLFDRAFLSDTARPIPTDWFSGLSILGKNLAQCSEQVGHHYYKTLSACPWCDVEKVSRWPVFSNVSSTGAVQGFDLQTIETLLRSISSAPGLGGLPTKTVLPTPSADLLKIRTRLRNVLLGVSATLAVSLIAAVLVDGPAKAFMGSILVVAVTFVWAFRSNKSVHEDAYGKYKVKRAEWTALEASWHSLRGRASTLQSTAKGLAGTVQNYKQLANIRVEKLKRLERDAYKYQLHNHLDKFRIANTDLTGIGWKKIQLLQSFGIESAADVDQNKILGIPGFGPAYTARLMNWRRTLEGRFVFNSATGVPKQELQRVEYECANARMKGEATLSASSKALRSDWQLYLQTKNQIERRASSALDELLQLQSNAGATTLVTLPMALLFAVAFGIPFVSLIATSDFQHINQPTSINSSKGDTVATLPSPATSSTPFTVNTNTNSNSAAVSTTDADIALLSDAEKEAKAKELFDKGVLLTRANKFAEAEKVYAEALRYRDSDVNILHELGYARYRLKRFADSIEALKKADKLSAGDADPELRRVLGLAYQGAQRWIEAEVTFKRLVDEDPYKFEYQYQYGISAKKAGDKIFAAGALERATSFKPNDARAHYELADLYIDLGRISAAEAELEILSRLDPKLADDIRSRLDQ